MALTVDVSNVSASLFVTGALFILLIFSLLSLGVLQMFQQRFRNGAFSFAGALVSGVAFGIVLNQWFL
ncbi:hypothetical protein [Paenibacillus methanolicus]|uniref:Uncharacterized protein n=1 Tax=Paenibacillus methanolicus TaxID=582686 RepID=A0A5S5C308_9BACL|nr:hypothetical protein [Paenibacillus methanolicus]TYP72710.1 hypothetical protein BCM02_108365 [Paenibacillus methanolicus]